MTNFIPKSIYLIIPFLLLASNINTKDTTDKKEMPQEKSQSNSKKIKVPKKQKKSSKKIKYPYPGKQLKDMTEDELNEVLTYAKHILNDELVFKVFHLLTTVSVNHNTLKKYKLDLAEYCYTTQNFEKAAVSYEEFFILYPGSDEAEYSQYKSILCWFYLSLEPDRDQTNTHKTLAVIEDFLRKAKDQKFIDEVKIIKKTCRKRLLDHEVYVFEHYVKQKKWTSAENRLKYIKEKFTDISNLEVYIAYLEKKLASVKKQNNVPFIFSINLKEAVQEHNNAIKHPEENLPKGANYFLA